MVRTCNYSYVINQFLQILFLAVILFSLILCPRAFCDHIISQFCVHVCLWTCPCVPYLLLRPFPFCCLGRLFLFSLQPPLVPQYSPSRVPQGSWHLSLSGISFYFCLFSLEMLYLKPSITNGKKEIFSD